MFLQGFLQLLPSISLLDGPLQGCASKKLLQPFLNLSSTFCFLQPTLISSFSSKAQLYWNRNWLILLSMHRENYLSAMTKRGWIQGLMREHAAWPLKVMNQILVCWEELQPESSEVNELYEIRTTREDKHLYSITFPPLLPKSLLG